MNRSVKERFESKFVKAEGCWEWTAGKVQGYGYFWDGERDVNAHRFAYELYVGPIPEGLEIDHLCRNRGCVWPEHLELVTRRVNILRGYGSPARNRRKTHCKVGHPLSGGNLYSRKDGHRKCRLCQQGRAARARAAARTLEGE